MTVMKEPFYNGMRTEKLQSSGTKHSRRSVTTYKNSIKRETETYELQITRSVQNTNMAALKQPLVSGFT